MQQRSHIRAAAAFSAVLVLCATPHMAVANLETGGAILRPSSPAPAPDAAAPAGAARGPSNAPALSPTDAAREEWRRIVCEGQILRTSGSEDELAGLARSPTGSLLPPGLHHAGFVEGWQDRMYPQPATATAEADAPAAKADEAAPARDGKTYVPLALALLLPAAGSYLFSRRQRETDALREKYGLGIETGSG